MTRNELAQSIRMHRKIFNSVEENTLLLDSQIMDKYFNFEETRMTRGDVLEESLTIRPKELFNELPEDLKKHFFSILTSIQ